MSQRDIERSRIYQNGTKITLLPTPNNNNTMVTAIITLFKQHNSLENKGWIYQLHFGLLMEVRNDGFLAYYNFPCRLSTTIFQLNHLILWFFTMVECSGQKCLNLSPISGIFRIYAHLCPDFFGGFQWVIEQNWFNRPYFKWNGVQHSEINK